jgi:hypothetical protein
MLGASSQFDRVVGHIFVSAKTLFFALFKIARGQSIYEIACDPVEFVRPYFIKTLADRLSPKARGRTLVSPTAMAENSASCSASPAGQCTSNPVSGRSLRKTGIIQ